MDIVIANHVPRLCDNETRVVEPRRATRPFNSREGLLIPYLDPKKGRFRALDSFIALEYDQLWKMIGAPPALPPRPPGGAPPAGVPFRAASDLPAAGQRRKTPAAAGAPADVAFGPMGKEPRLLGAMHLFISGSWAPILNKPKKHVFS